jgi:hypothetical protein
MDLEEKLQELDALSVRLKVLITNLEADRGIGIDPMVASAAALTRAGGSACLARRLTWEVETRDRLFPDELFADPAWLILLDLFTHRATGKLISVSSACIASLVPPTTALRYIRRLVELGMVQRSSDTADRRKVYLQLTDYACSQMEAFFTKISSESSGPSPLNLENNVVFLGKQT